MILQDLQAPEAVSRTWTLEVSTRQKNPKAQNGDGVDVTKGHRMSGRQSQAAEVSWVLCLGFRFLIPHRDQERLFHLLFD